MTKVVLSRDTKKKELSLCTKLHYLENKYKEISAYVQISECSDIWIRVKNPFSLLDIPENKIRIHSGDQASTIHGIYNKYLIDLDELTLDNLRFDEDFIKVVEDGDKIYDDNLKVETRTYPVANIRIEVDKETNREVAVFNPQWFSSELEYQYVEYDDAQDIDKVKNLLAGTNYYVSGLNDTSTLVINSKTSNFIVEEGTVIIKTKSNNVYVVDKETFDNWG